MNKQVSVVLIPGFMLDETLWDEVCLHLPEDWVITRAALSGGDNIQDIAHHIARHSPDHFALVGFSLGGYVARQLAIDYPDRVRALVVVASSLREDTEQQARLKMEAVQALSPASFSGLSSKSIAKSLHPDHASDTHLITRIKNMGNRLGYQAFAMQSGLRRAGISSESIQCPTLVVASTQDNLRSIEETTELVNALPGATLTLLEESGHMIPLEQPQELATLLADWLNKHLTHDKPFEDTTATASHFT